jgi:hypothetical protein
MTTSRRLFRRAAVAALSATLCAAALGAGATPAIAQDDAAAEPTALGDPSRDLVFTPVPRCRVIDTRVEGGRLSLGVPRHFDVAGSLVGQGGAPDCLVPVGASVVLVKVTPVRPDGSGDLTIWPFGGPSGTGSVIRFKAGTRGNQIVAAEFFLSICNPALGGCTHDLTVQSNGTETDMVTDVTGYFAAAPPVPWSALGGMPAGFADNTDNDLLAGLACGAGQVPKRTNGVWVCAADTDTTYSAAAAGGLALSSGAFSVANLGITNGMLAADAVTTAKIANDAVTSAEIAPSSVGSSEIQMSAVGSDEIATGAVGTAEIADGSILTADIGQNTVGRLQITGSEIPVYTVTSSVCASREITLSSTCSTLLCNPLANDYFTCTGECSASSSRSCPNSVIGYLIAP